MYTAILQGYPTGLNSGSEILGTLDRGYETRDEARREGRREWKRSIPDQHGRVRVVDLESPEWSYLKRDLITA